VATGQDWRAIEAGAHSYATYKRNYTSLTRYYKAEVRLIKINIFLPAFL
jgi:hydroxymethylglutaryl-CoA reductase